MRILIMVLSFNEPPFDTLMQMQLKTWDSVQVGGVDTVFYHGGEEQDFSHTSETTINPNSVIIQFNCTDEYYLMAGKFKYALQACKLDNYDIIFRTNSSSYVNKKELVEFAKKLPKEKLYAGWEIEGNAGYNVCSGAGFFLSPDTAKILRDNIDPDFAREEDVYCASILHEAGIKIIDDRSRFDVDPFHDCIPLDRYHYRFKTNNRITDAHNMVMVHKKILAQ